MSSPRTLDSTPTAASGPVDPSRYNPAVAKLSATRGSTDPELRSLIVRVAEGTATQDQLKMFLKHLDETRMITSQKQNEATPLLTLPPELHEAILRHVPRASDLRNVSLACKALSHAAIPFLYHEMHLDLGDPSSIRRRLRKCDELPAGLRYTRHLKITFTNGVPRSLEQRLGWQGVMSVLRRILPRLPHDGLRSLEAPMNVPWDLGTLMILWKGQHKLERLANLSLEPDTVSLLEPGYSTRSLDLPHSIGTLEDADFNEAILTDCSQISRLAVRTQHILDPDRVHEEGSLQNISISYGVLYQALFDRIKPLSLHELCFQEQELEHFSTQLTRAINVEILQFLHLYLCDGSDQLMDALAAQNDDGRSSLKLRGFIYEQSWLDDGNCESLENFLGSFQGLEYLQIRCGNSGNDYDAGTVLGHKKTLKDLYIGIGVSEHHDEHEQPWQWFLNMDDLRRLSDVQHLRQVALAVPDTLLDSGNFASRLDVLAKCTELEILRLLTWPGERPTGSSSLIESLAAYVRTVDSLATTIMQRLSASKSKFKLLIIGDSLAQDETLQGPFPDLKCMCYIPGSRRDLFGGDQVFAVPVDRKVVSKIVPLYDAFHKVSRDLYEDFGIGLGDYGLSTHQRRGYTVMETT